MGIIATDERSTGMLSPQHTTRNQERNMTVNIPITAITKNISSSCQGKWQSEKFLEQQYPSHKRTDRQLVISNCKRPYRMKTPKLNKNTVEVLIRARLHRASKIPPYRCKLDFKSITLQWSRPTPVDRKSSVAPRLRFLDNPSFLKGLTHCSQGVIESKHSSRLAY